MPYSKVDPLKRILRKVFKTETCWYWLGCLSSHAYGKTNIGMRGVHAHTAVFELSTGQRVPKGMVLRHSCDTPFCVNPAHLSVGTRSQNAKEMFDRGRWGTGKVWTRGAAQRFLKPFRALKAKEVEASAIPGLPAVVAERVQRTASCWLWTGPNDQQRGYGRVFVGKGRYEQAHRYIYRRLVGAIPRGLELRHSCDDPRCVNPAHLTPGTTQENARDRQDRDRGRAKPGERHPEAKLTENLVSFIRYAVPLGVRGTQARVARALGVSAATVNRIIKGHIWRHTGFAPNL